MEILTETATYCCVVCSTTDQNADLIEMEANSMKCGEEIIEFSDLMLEVLQAKLDSGLICKECQHLLMQFYFFKLNAKQNLIQHERTEKDEIVRKLEMFLEDSETEDLAVLRYNQCFMVVPESKRSLFHNFQSWQPRVLLQEPEVTSPEELAPEKTTPELLPLPAIDSIATDEEELKVEAIEEEIESVIEELSEESETVIAIETEPETEPENGYEEFLLDEEQEKDCTIKTEYLQCEPMIEDPLRENLVISRTTELKLTQPNYISKHTIEQRKWANELTKSAYSTKELDGGVVPIWTCSICFKDYRSPQAIRLHLLAKHIEDAVEIVDSFSPEIKNWLRDEYQERRVKVETEDGTKYKWICGVCKFSTATGKAFKEHLVESHIEHEKPQEVESTDNQFNTKRAPDENRNKCQKCEQSFESEKTLKKHLRDHAMKLPTDDFKEKSGPIRARKSKNVSFQWTCKECWFQFSAQRAYDSHIKLHETLRELSQFTVLNQCEECNMFFRNIDDLSSHVDGHSEGQSVLVPAEGIPLQKTILFKRLPVPAEADEVGMTCGHCGRKFDDGVMCKNHLLIHHTNPIVCPQDGREFRSMQPYICHLQKVHSELLPESLLCTHCRASFDNIYERLAHMKQCDSKIFACDHCDKKFSNKNYLNSHLKRETGLLSVKCQICSKLLKAKDELKIHMRSHTKEKPYKCSICDKSYTTTSARASHMETHKDTVIMCEICSVKFIARRHYIVHYKRYHDEDYRQRKFLEQTCRFCGKQFLRRDRLREHIQKSHPNENC